MRVMQAKPLIIATLLLAISTTEAGWNFQVHTDDFEGTTRHLIISDSTSPTETMSWPRDNAFAYMYYDCDAGDFTLRVTASNLVDSETKDGFNKISMRIKADNEVFSAKGSQDWGSEFISIERRFTIKILEASKLQSLRRRKKDLAV